MKYFRKYFCIICAFVLLDQLIKTVIYNFFFELDLDIIGSFIRFHPKININLSWGGNFISLFRNFGFLVLVNLLIIILFISGYSFYRSKKDVPSIQVNIIYILGLSGSFCSLIDKIIWKGSLDFIQIPHLFIFDSKDVYLTIAQCLFVIIGVKHNKEISVNEYLRWCYKRYKFN